jgi:hypothetical protein
MNNIFSILNLHLYPFQTKWFTCLIYHSNTTMQKIRTINLTIWNQSYQLLLYVLHREWPDSGNWHICGLPCSATWDWNTGGHWHQYTVHSISCCSSKDSHRKSSGKCYIQYKIFMIVFNNYLIELKDCILWWLSINKSIQKQLSVKSLFKWLEFYKWKH